MKELPEQVSLFLERKFTCERDRVTGMRIWQCLARRGMFRQTKQARSLPCNTVRCSQGDENEDDFRNVLKVAGSSIDQVALALNIRKVAERLPQETEKIENPDRSDDLTIHTGGITMSKEKKTCNDCGKGLRKDSQGLSQGLCSKCFKALRGESKPRKARKAPAKSRLQSRADRAVASVDGGSKFSDIEAVVSITKTLESLDHDRQARVLRSALVVLGNEELLAS